MNDTAVSVRWEAEMVPFFDLPDGRDKSELDLVFDLDAQLAALGESPAPIGEPQ